MSVENVESDESEVVIDTEALIELVRQKKFLYDVSDPQYLNFNRKNLLWEEIGKKLNAPAQDCKSRWNNIRDQFRKSLKKNSKTQYKFHNQLYFLLPYFIDRGRSKQSISLEGSIADEVRKNISQGSMRRPSSERPIIQKSITKKNIPPVKPQRKEVMPRISSVHSLQLSIDLLSSENHEIENSMDVENPHEIVKPEKCSMVGNSPDNLESNQTQAEHAVDKFLQGIAPTIKSLPPFYQNLAKTEIFAIVQKYEIAVLTQSPEVPINIDLAASKLVEDGVNK